MDDVIHKKYWYIDEGGFSFSVDKYGGIEIHFGFYGYSTTTIYLTRGKNFGAKELAEFFQEATFKLKDLEKNNK